MILTEEEAKTKWCPDSRVLLSAGLPQNRAAAVNRLAVVHDLTRCLGSACMAWRWYEGSIPRHRTGYCGKAGEVKP